MDHEENTQVILYSLSFLMTQTDKMYLCIMNLAALRDMRSDDKEQEAGLGAVWQQR